MSGFELGVIAACAASALLNLGVILQALDAREIPARHSLRLSLLARLARRPRWLAGTALGYLAVPLEVLALSRAPLVVVEPLLGLGLLLLLAAGRPLLHERIHLWQVVGMFAIVAGLALVAWGGPSGHGEQRSTSSVALVIGSVAAVALAPYLLRRRPVGIVLLLLSSAAGFSAANLAINALSTDMRLGDYLACAGWLTVAAVTGLAATLGQMSAFQRDRATRVVPVTFVIPNFLPVALAPLFLREQWSTTPLGGAVLAIGVVVSLGGSLAVSRSPQAGALLAAGAGRPE
ncbi:MAG: hypothetical protein ACRDJX_03725 [Solirubrobacteraceae bacterium]